MCSLQGISADENYEEPIEEPVEADVGEVDELQVIRTRDPALELDSESFESGKYVNQLLHTMNMK